MMKKDSFEEVSRKQRFSLRKLNIGVASVLLGVTIFGLNLSKNDKLVHADTVEAQNSSNTNDKTADVINNTTTETSKNTTAEKVDSSTESTNSSTATTESATKSTDATNSTTDKKADTQTQLSAPAGVEVVDPSHLTDSEKSEVESAIKVANSGVEIKSITVNDDGAASVTLENGMTQGINSTVVKKATTSETTSKNSETATSSTQDKQATQTASNNSDSTKVSSNTTNKSTGQSSNQTTNTQVASNIDKTLASRLTQLLATASTTDDSASDSSTLPKSDQTVTKVTDPMMSDYQNRGGKNTWIDQTVAPGWNSYDFAGKTETRIFGDDGIIK